VKPDGIWGGGASYPGKPSCSGADCCRRRYKTEPTRRTRSGEGAKGGRFTGSTDDSGPMKPGNSGEDKTLTTGEIQTQVLYVSSMEHGKPWTKGDYDSVDESI